MLFGEIYKNRKVLITGHAGFKGSWLVLMLNTLGAKVYGYSLVPNTDETAYATMNISNILEDEVIGDIRDSQKLLSFFKKVEPEIVFHLAAQPLVRLSYSLPHETYETNIMGTLNVMEAARICGSVKTFVNVTTDKCYENMEVSYAYKESDPMGGYDMYSSSKACSEILTASYRRSFLANGESFALGSARAGNVIGGGDWSLDRLIPDCAKALSQANPIIIRNPDSVRPWQHVMESLTGYMLLAWHLMKSPKEHSQGYNFGPDNNSVLKVGDIVKEFLNAWGEGRVEIRKSEDMHEACLLMLDISKSRKELGFEPVMTAKEAVNMTAKWYKHFYANDLNMQEFTKLQIDQFFKEAAAKNLIWTK